MSCNDIGSLTTIKNNRYKKNEYMKTENRTFEKHQFSIIMNNAIREQLKYLATKQQKTEAKFLKDLVNRCYLDEVTNER